MHKVPDNLLKSLLLRKSIVILGPLLSMCHLITGQLEVGYKMKISCMRVGKENIFLTKCVR